MAYSEQGREGGTGRYTWTVDRLCTCGHALAMHTAARGKVDGKMCQPCIVGDFEDVDCSCECFAPAHKTNG